MHPELLLSTSEPHHISIVEARKLAQKLFVTKYARGKIVRLTKKEAATIAATIRASEQSKVYGGVNFSRIQIPTVFIQRDEGVPVEFETFCPYLSNYLDMNGNMTIDTLINEDVIGLELARVFRALFPDARLVSLYDDYNGSETARQDGSRADSSFDPRVTQNFIASLNHLFRSQGVILPSHKVVKDFLLISEAAKVIDAKKLVRKLSMRGYIKREGRAIMFYNIDAENPLYRQFYLRTRQGRWLCEALDAATFLSDRNLLITHIIVLPDYMRPQQDKVWEILRVLGMQPARYHNIFFDPAADPQTIAASVSTAFRAMMK